MRLKKLTVKNFKSLKDCEVELGKFNVLIGPNASGKTNLVEVFKLLRKIYVERDTNPFLEWWGYNNVVWAGKEELPITVGMLFDVKGYDVYFETTFTGTGGSFRILKEVLEVLEYVRIEKTGNIVKVAHSNELAERIRDVLDTAENIAENVHTNDIDTIRTDLRKLKGFVTGEYSLEGIPPNWTLFSALMPNTPQTMLINVLFKRTPLRVSIVGNFPNYGLIVSPAVTQEDALIYPNIVSSFPVFFGEFLDQLPVRDVNPPIIRKPQYPRKETTLNEDASNLIPILYNIWLREGRLSDEIAKPLFIAFPNTRVFFQLTEDGRVMMKVFENGLELAPPGISDGFYKVLAILTVAYLKPPLLIIDEIENSLHPETLELIIDTLRESESQVIITTHSPVVVDIVEPSDLVLVDKEHGETLFRRIKDPEKIKKFLNEKGLTLSEGWLYGSLLESDKQ
ncbi:recombinase RecF [Thermococcus indicus]|uniref:Recombinase RecF n=1 Tax=Thermococcus indicus TaxID=2586643 RepID=A0A4Y5SJE5_9EURY|nr:AAA family ATPase [Thermococcus indicus]QDA30998.1 recombinase RecF [Thermococcus indicus]